ncbi:MAG TPA: VanZ family protein [Allosphingosinicella sp.]|uniref:VanZ family protein n=1 Tax=Allosphingosinicella sp. TaxID=2823234 RepID=UPI002ED9B1A5
MEVKESGLFQRALVLTFWVLIVVTFLVSTWPRPFRVPGDPSDKLLHFSIFLVLTALAAAAYPKARLARIGVGMALFGAAIEAVQAMPFVNRSPEFLDWIADIAGAGLALMAAALIRRL